MEVDISIKKVVVLFLSTIAALTLIFCIFGSFYTVNQKNAAVLTFWGKYERVETAGLHFKIPFAESTTTYSLATQQIDVEKTNVQTSDNQKAFISMIVQYDIPPSGIPIIYSKYPDYENRIYNLSRDIMRNTFGKYNVMDIPMKRQEIESEILSKLGTEAKHLYGANVTEVQINDVSYTDAFDHYINMMTKAKADVEQAHQQQIEQTTRSQTLVIQAKAEADSNIAAAKGQAESMRLTAEATANKTRIEGEAQADAIRAQTSALNTSPQFVNYTVAKTWDGKLPVSIGVGANSKNIPMLNLGDIH